MQDLDLFPDEASLAQMQRAYAQMLRSDRAPHVPTCKMPVFATPQAQKYLQCHRNCVRAIDAIPPGTWRAAHVDTLVMIRDRKCKTAIRVEHFASASPAASVKPMPPMPIKQALARLLSCQNACLHAAANLRDLCPGAMRETLETELLCAVALYGILL